MLAYLYWVRNEACREILMVAVRNLGLFVTVEPARDCECAGEVAQWSVVVNSAPGVVKGVVKGADRGVRAPYALTQKGVFSSSLERIRKQISSTIEWGSTSRRHPM